MDHGTFRPFLYWCQGRREAGAGVLDSDAQRCCYTIWNMREGSGVLQLGRDRSLVLRPGRMALCDPGVVLVRKGAVDCQRLAFDLMDRPRCSTPDGLTWWPVDWTPQPPLREVFGLDLTGFLREAETTAGKRLFDMTQAFWWRSTGELIRHSLHLGLWLLELAEARGARGFDPWALPTQASLADQAEAIMTHQFGPGRTLGDIAHQLGVSREHLARTYRRQRGQSPGSYLRLCRLRQACRQLERSEASPAEIATAVGFGSFESMRRAFVTHLGEAPGAWRMRRRRPRRIEVASSPSAPQWK
jgi:AraC-like DNA-binding protein